MGRGSSGAGGGGAKGGGKKIPGGGISVDRIVNAYNNDGIDAAGDVLNDMTEAGDVFLFTPDEGPQQLWGKTYNDEYYPFNDLGLGVASTKFDSNEMAAAISDPSLTGGGKWSIFKYSGEVSWKEKKTSKYDSGERTAVKIPKIVPTVNATKRTTVNGYDIYDISDGPGFFKRVAVKSGS